MRILCNLWHIVALLILFANSYTVLATPPQYHHVEYNGEISGTYTDLELPENEIVHDIRYRTKCSSIGTPKGMWRIVDNRLWLIKLTGCRGPFSLEKVYGGNGQPMFASWVTKEIKIQQGKRLCEDIGLSIYENTILLKIKDGILINVEKFPTNDPEMPSREIYEKLFFEKLISQESFDVFIKAIEEGEHPCGTAEIIDKNIRMNRK